MTAALQVYSLAQKNKIPFYNALTLLKVFVGETNMSEILI